jgi:uncharacterized GH25 family protein
MSIHACRVVARRLAFLLAGGVLVASTPLAAHDMWIEPTGYHSHVGEIVGLKLRVGQDFLGDPLPRDPALIDQFISLDAGGRRPIVGRDGQDPAGLVRVSSPGVLIVGYRSRPTSVVLPAEKFNQYLKEEGLETIAALRAERHQTGADAHEMFSRCAKSLIASGPSSDMEGDRALGFTLELVAERNPYVLKASDELPTRLTYEKRPLAGALVVAINRANPSSRISARTDASGRVRLRLTQSGNWLVKAVHVTQARPGSGAEWESFWASLTFDLPGGMQ